VLANARIKKKSWTLKVQFDILDMCLFIRIYARITLNSTPSPRGPNGHGKCLSPGTSYSRKRLPQRGWTMFSWQFCYFVLIFCFFQTLCIHVCTLYIFASRTEPGQKNNDKKKSIPLGGDKNVNDILYTDMRTRLYIYI